MNALYKVGALRTRVVDALYKAGANCLIVMPPALPLYHFKWQGDVRGCHLQTTLETPPASTTDDYIQIVPHADFYTTVASFRYLEAGQTEYWFFLRHQQSLSTVSQRLARLLAKIALLLTAQE